MCIHEFYLSTACGHHFPKLPPSAKPNTFFNNYHRTIAVPQSLTCAPVKLALKFYHDQVVYLPADMNCGAKVEIPKSCPIVHSPRDGPTKRTIMEDEKARDLLNNNMLRNGLGPWQQWQIQIEAANLDQCSNRAKPGEHSPAALRRHKEQRYPQNMFAHVRDVKAFQERDKRHMMPNVRYINVDFGCGAPFSARCLTGWDGAGLLTHRLHLWSDSITHPEPCSQKCLAGWSGADLDMYRQQTWPGRTPQAVNPDIYAKTTREYTNKHTQHWVNINYSNVSHLHADQFDWNGTRFVRKYNLPNKPEVHVPDTVWVPAPGRLYQVLCEMSHVRVPGSPSPEEVDRASIEDILGRLPEAFEEQVPLSREVSQPSVEIAEGSESTSTLVEEPAVEPEPIPTETPEAAEARRQRAREVMREKLKRDFSKEKGETVVEEEKDSAKIAMAENTGNPTAEAVKDKELEAEAKNTELTTSSSMETTRAKALPNSATPSHTASPSPLPSPVTTTQRQAPLTALEHPPSDVDESNSSPIETVGDDSYDTEECE